LQMLQPRAACLLVTSFRHLEASRGGISSCEDGWIGKSWSAFRTNARRSRRSICCCSCGADGRTQGSHPHLRIMRVCVGVGCFSGRSTTEYGGVELKLTSKVEHR
jgi:hypothetical protein